MKNLIKKVLYFKLPIKIGEKSFLIPIIKGVGINNLRLKNDWFIFLLNRINLPEHSYFIDVGVNRGQTLLKFRSHFFLLFNLIHQKRAFFVTRAKVDSYYSLVSGFSL